MDATPYERQPEEDGPSVSYETLAALLILSELRSQFRVGLAVAQRFPDEASWTALTKEPELLESLDALGEIIRDIQMDSVEPTAEAISGAVTNHYDRALEAIGPVASRLGVEDADLLAVLVNA